MIGFRSEQKICWWFSRGVVGWAWVQEDFHCPKQLFTVLSTSESLTELGAIGISGSPCRSFWFRWWGISPDNLYFSNTFLTHSNTLYCCSEESQFDGLKVSHGLFVSQNFVESGWDVGRLISSRMILILRMTSLNWIHKPWSLSSLRTSFYVE